MKFQSYLSTQHPNALSEYVICWIWKLMKDHTLIREVKVINYIVCSFRNKIISYPWTLRRTAESNKFFLTVESQKRLVLEMHPPAEDQALDKQFNHICKSMQVSETSLQFSVSKTTTKFPCIVTYCDISILLALFTIINVITPVCHSVHSRSLPSQERLPLER